MPGFRAIVLDRPGWGLSTPVDFRARLSAYVADILAGSLDGLGIDRVDVVGGSIGDVWALSLAEHHPARVERIVLLGGGPSSRRSRVPRSSGLASPIGALIVRLPMNAIACARSSRQRPRRRASRPGASRTVLRLASGGANDTASMRHERDMVRSIVRGSGWQPGFMFEDGELAAIEQPTLSSTGRPTRPAASTSGGA